MSVFLVPFVASPQTLLNFKHLEHLTERIRFLGDTVDIVHVYANYPSYNWTDAKESGPEGVACVDDAARAAVVYMRHFEITKDPQSLDKAKGLVRFVMNMQADDGQFYNFVFQDHSINRDGRTSFKSFGWWAARAVWCLGLGYRILQNVDEALASEIQTRINKTFPHIDTLLTRHGKIKEHGRFKSPQWLLYEEAADATSELLFGLIEYYRATGNQRVGSFIEKLSKGLIMMQDGDHDSFPFGLHRSWRTTWHMWGNGQTQALASAGKILNQKSFIDSAEREAKFFYSRLLIEGFFKEVDVMSPEKSVVFEQIAYGVRPMAVGLLRLYEATQKNEYLIMASLAASWFFGNNAAKQEMYDPVSGRCFDGIKDSSTVNKNSGAESTIEALHTLLELEQYPLAMKYLRYKKFSQGVRKAYLYAVFADSIGNEITLALELKEGHLRILEGNESREFLRN